MSTHEVSGNKNRWVEAKCGLPPFTAVQGGEASNGEPIYVARASHEGDLVPGKFMAPYGCALISWGGEEISKNEFEVLVGNSNNWIATSGSNIPSGAFPGGQTKSGETLYVGRVRYEGSITTGYVQASRGVCNIPYSGKELSFINYELLTY